MIEHPYLIAIAIIEEGGKRAMPLGGKSLPEFIKKNESPISIGGSLIQQLLIRVFQRSGEGNIRRYNGDKSLLLIQISMVSMQEKIPLIKSEWINNGDSEKLISQLRDISEDIWKVNFTREEGIHSIRLAN